MLILEAGNIKKYFSDRLVIDFEELKIYSEDKIGVVGQNGAGKTTLINILSKELAPDEGFVKQYGDMAYIRQFSDESIQASPRVIKEFHLADKQHQQTFSGGEKTRIRISNALSQDTVLLFADEPTANLDYKGVTLLRQKLSRVNTFVLISHDRALLDDLCNKILEIRDGKIKLYHGNYSFYKEQSEKAHQHATQEYQKYTLEKSKLEEALCNRQIKSRSVRKTPKRMGNSEARLHKRKATEKQEKIDNVANSLKTRLEKLEVKEKPKELPQIKLDFSLTHPPQNKIVISGEGLAFSYGSKRIFDNAEFNVFNGTKTALWGENGAGKTTLLNIIHSRSNSDISVAPKVKIGYFYQGFENLDHNKTVFENVMRDSVQCQTVVRTILSRLLFSAEDIHKKVDVLSGGEKIKVSFSKLFVSSANTLLLDEPTNYLDMQSIEALENVLRDYEGTVLFISHDKAFVNTVANRMLVLENQAITAFEGNLEEYLSSKQKQKTELKDETERMVLQMRMTEVISKLSRADTDKEALEKEYQRLLEKQKSYAR